MAELPPTPDASPLTLGTATGWRWLVYLVCGPLGLFFLGSPLLFYQGQLDGTFLGLTAVVALLGLLLLAAALEVYRARFILTNEQFVYAGAFRRRELWLRDLRGFRVDNRYLRLFAHGRRRPVLTLGYTTESFAELPRYLAARGVPDLDQTERQAEEAQLLHDDSFGFTEPQRLARLTRARQVCRVVNGLGLAAGGAVWLAPAPAAAAAVGAALLLPLLAVGVLHWGRGLVQLDEVKSSARPGVVTALLLPAAGLTLRALADVEALHYAPVWRTAALVAGVLLAGLLSSRGRKGVAVLIMGPLLALAYGFGAVQLINSTFDRAPAQVYAAAVRGRHSSSGKTTTYYLELSPWGPRRKPENVTVSGYLYERTQPGDSVRVRLWPGRLGIPWFRVGE